MKKVLFVDDDTSLLHSIRHALNGKYDVHLAGSSIEGLLLFEKEGFFPLVVADYQMPGSDGISFLAAIGRISPDSVRILLTGYSQFDLCIRAINEGNIFRFLSKPCPLDTLEKAVGDGMHQYNLLQTERELYVLQRWNSSLGDLIKAFSLLMESKDPYTAGHQARVSRLSVAIAEQLGFPRAELEEIQMTAIVHDIGKIYVPSQFLNKPGFLNSHEMEIVKMHAQVGHDVLSPLGFPFPIHEVVLQHHERLDGSGYPRGLTEPQINIWAKIIAVADTAEAIAHHRPYRPAKGIDEAIKELRNNQGRKYDTRIVEIAATLLQGNKFQFE
ncbi:MAG TPA: HD domain-containing phosphohydrolase [Dissulfurispiraceae bacterium]|nr:HD domain-containing phosphohydrolase [Dissulfurispiraceae bacterium]